MVLYKFAILLTHFMKEYFNSFDDIQFFHTFSSISQDMYIQSCTQIIRPLARFYPYDYDLCKTNYILNDCISKRLKDRKLK